ncbi:MAG: hypothetical protein QGI09_07815, partial [Dehalococcoidia bacterium]|nr:hypothetical protein [Dehalococcoidia bacterium]
NLWFVWLLVAVDAAAALHLVFGWDARAAKLGGRIVSPGGALYVVLELPLLATDSALTSAGWPIGRLDKPLVLTGGSLE